MKIFKYDSVLSVRVESKVYRKLERESQNRQIPIAQIVREMLNERYYELK